MSARQEQLRDRFMGAIMGLAVGEALAAPAVSRAHYSVEAAFPNGIQDMLGGGALRAEPGELLSGGAQLLEVMESYAINQEVEGFDLAYRLGSLTASDVKGFSQDERMILGHLYENPETFDSAAQRFWADSCGTISDASAIPRASLAACVHADDIERMIADTVRLVKITHADPRCAEAALAFNFLLVQCIKGHFSTDLPRQAAGFVTNIRQTELYSRVVLDFGELRLRREYVATAALPYPEDVEGVTDALDGVPKRKVIDLRTTDTAADVVATGAWALINAKDFGPGVSAIATLGGAADRQSAIAGALLGARFGMSRIPPVWLRKLEARVRIVTLVEKLFALAAPVA